VVALQVRDRGGDDGDGGGDASSGGTVLCVPEVEQVCRALAEEDPDLEVTIEEAGTTFERLSTAGDADDVDVDAWLAPAPFPAMVDGARAATGLDPLFGEASPVLARSPLVLVLWDDRLAVLEAACGGEPDWRCIGELSGGTWADIGGQSSWGRLKPGHGPADTSATGLLVLAQASGQYLGRTDYASNDFADPGYRAWLTQLEDAVPTFTPSAGTPLDQLLFSGPSSFDAVGSFEADAGPAVSTSRDADRLSVLYPEPVTTMDLVAAPVAGRDRGEDVRDLLEDDAPALLAAAGWRVAGQDPVEGVRADVALPDSSNLPSAGVLQALRSTWREVT
jgi:hypothetical protein